MSDQMLFPGVTNDELRAIAERYGTPSYVFDTAAFRARLRSVRDIFGPNVRLCFSIKANPFLIGAAVLEGLDLEVCSPGELALCKAWNVDAKRIVYSGVCKQEADTREALAYGVGVFTAESLGQLALVNRSAEEAGAVVPVLLRLNAGSQFGMSLEDLIQAVDEHASWKGVELVGIHYFAGTQRLRIKQQRRELEKLRDTLKMLEDKHSGKPAHLEYGPGLGEPYFIDEDFSDTLAPARELSQDLQLIAQDIDLAVEMGRFFAADCGSYLARIVDQKENKGTSYAFIDGGMNHVSYLGQMMGMKVPVIDNLSAETRASADDVEREWSLCGSLCTTADVLVRSTSMRDLRMDDLLAFRNIGAYSVTEGIYLFLSRTMPRIVLRHGPDDWELARDLIETSSLCTPQNLLG